ncbi:MAG: hypothetical protein ACPG31_11755 [Planctomycetota bacterium]
MFLSLILSTLPLTTGPEEPLAVLDDGTRLPVLASVEVGTFLVRTPYGVLRSEGQQVIALVDGVKETELLEPLRDLDYATWVQRCSERGLLERLLAEPIDDSNRELIFGALHAWGKRIDPLPSKLDRDDRVEALWGRMKKTEGGQLALLVGAMEGEISNSSVQNDRKVTLSDWRDIMDDRNPEYRWAATRIAAVQQDNSMVVMLLDSSLEDRNLWVRRAGAKALLETDPKGALYRWAYELVTDRNKGTKRQAAFLLGELGRLYPEIAQDLADKIREGAFLSGGSGSSSAGGGCSSPSPAITFGGGDLGPSVTEGSVIELKSPSKTEMLTIADVLERVATPGTQAKLPGESPEEGLEHASEEQRGDAWRKALMGR